MTFERKTGICFGHSFSIVNHLNTGFTCVSHQHMYILRICINRIFYQLLDNGRRTLYYFTGSNLISYRIW